MEMFNAISILVILVVILGAITVGMFTAGCYFCKCQQDRLAVILIFAMPCFVAGMISLTALVNVVYYWTASVSF